jgi:hypothetical protein
MQENKGRMKELVTGANLIFSIDCMYQLLGLRGSKECCFAKFSKNFFLFSGDRQGDGSGKKK